MTWLIEHWTDVLTALLAFSAAFALVAKLTPWGWDDKASDALQRLMALVRRDGAASKRWKQIVEDKSK
jgi:hypothetical protein